MATRTKTIEYHLPTDTTSLDSVTRRDLAAITLYIPESSITFRSVEVRLFVADTTTVVSLTSWLIGIKLGAVAFNDATITDTINNSGESQSYVFTRDVTSYFATNWTGTSMTCQVGCQFGAGATINHSAKLIITYDYDDASATHIKTIRIPIESTRSLLTTTYQTIGGATAIPAITGSYIPESGVTIRQTSLELWSNDRSTSGTYSSEVRINGGADITWYQQLSTQSSARWAYGVLDITAQDLSVARSLEGRVVTTTDRMDQVCGLVTVTYEFDPSASTTIFNSLMIGGADTTAHMHGTAAADNNRWARTISIQEPGTISLQISGVCLFMNSAASFTFNVRAGSQSYTSYAMSFGGLQCGQSSLIHRIDAGGNATTAGITLARGFNSYALDWYSSSLTEGWNLSGFLIFNYTSGKHSDGVGAHSRTIYKSIQNTAADTRVLTSSSVAPIDIAESTYYVVGVLVYLPTLADNSTNLSFVVDVERLSGETEEQDGWEDIYIGTAFSDNENNLCTIYGTSRRSWRRWIGDPDTNRMDLEAARRFRVLIPSLAWSGIGMYVTYHAITYDISGVISDSNGGSITINAFRSDTNEFIMSTSRTGDGAYSMTWYDDTQNIYTQAYESNTSVGRSGNGTAS